MDNLPDTNHRDLYYCNTEYQSLYHERFILIDTLIGYLFSKPVDHTIIMDKHLELFSDKKKWLRPLSNIELNSYAKQLNLKHYRKTIARDQLLLPKYRKINKFESFIINLDPIKSNKGGTHWVALIKEEDNVYYFDSYGSYPPNEVKDRYVNHKLISNTIQFQNFKSVYCGMISLYVIYSMENGSGFIDTMIKIKNALR